MLELHQAAFSKDCLHAWTHTHMTFVHVHSKVHANASPHPQERQRQREEQLLEVRRQERLAQEAAAEAVRPQPMQGKWTSSRLATNQP